MIMYYFNIFLNKSSYYDIAAEKEYIICIPLYSCMKLNDIETDSFLKSHILYKSPYLKNEYLTLTNENVCKGTMK